MTEDFFAEAQEQSRVKSRIVTKYFGAWAQIILASLKFRDKRIGYLDLFAGPGHYADGTPSTPIIVLEMAVADAKLCEALVTTFNDKTTEFARSLREAIDAMPGIEKLKYRPDVRNEVVGSDVVKALRARAPIPTLLFIDPWGYKGVSLALIGTVLRSWGSDCIFFFNYNRINAGLNNRVVRDHMDGLFGARRASRVRQKLAGLSPEEREILMVEEFSQALKEAGAKYVLPFTFKNESGTRTRHHLIFSSKNFTAYEIMKDIMAKESSDRDQSVATFIYSPASAKYPTLFELSRPLDDLEEMLIKEFNGRSLPAGDVYRLHSVGKPYVKAHYKKVLVRMEAAGTVQCDPPAKERRKILGEVTLTNSVIIHFRRVKK